MEIRSPNLRSCVCVYIYICIQLPPGFCVADPFGATPFAPPQEHVDASSVQWALLQFCVGEGTLKRQRLLFLHVNGQDKKGEGKKPVLGSWIHMENHATSSNIQDSNHLVECRLNSIYSYLFLVLFFECRFCLLEISRGQVGQVTNSQVRGPVTNGSNACFLSRLGWRSFNCLWLTG